MAHPARSNRTRGEVGVGWLTEQRSASQRTVACCNCSTCWKSRSGSSAYAAAHSSCCRVVDSTPEDSTRCSGVLARRRCDGSFSPQPLQPSATPSVVSNSHTNVRRDTIRPVGGSHAPQSSDHSPRAFRTTTPFFCQGVALVLLLIGASSRKGDLLTHTIRDNFFVDKSSAVIGIQSQDGKREMRPSGLPSSPLGFSPTVE